MSNEWPEIEKFAFDMQRRLEEKETDPRKRDKAWKNMPLILLEDEFRNQVIQLGYAFRQDNKELIRKKSVDVANFCMMIHDKTE